MSNPDKTKTQSKNSKSDEKHNSLEENQVLPKTNFERTITVYVGSAKVPFVVHTEVICEKSRFFKAACSDRWIEGQTKTVDLPEENPQVFQLYVSWLYKAKISLPGTEAGYNQNALMLLYVLGDVLDDYQLRNAAMVGMIDNIRNMSGCAGPQVIQRFYGLTPVGSPLRRFLVRWTLSRSHSHMLRPVIGSFPEEFLQDIALAGIDAAPVLSRAGAADVFKQYFKPETGSK